MGSWGKRREDGGKERKEEGERYQNEHSWREEVLKIKNINKIDNPKWLLHNCYT